MPRKAKWSFLVFMAGDNTLSSAGDKDLIEMRQVGSTPEVNILVEFDDAGAPGSRRIRVASAGKKEITRKMKETDCGDPNALLGFIQWAAKRYPAEHYVLDLWSHGSAWEPSEIDRVARSVGSPQYTPKEAVQRSSSPLGNVVFRTTLERIFSLSTPSERAICVDDGSGHSLDTVELGNVLKQAVEILGQPLDLLGMDACLMSNIEVAYQVRSYARYMVGSEESEPNDGWPYDRILRKLVDTPDLPASELAKAVVSDYVQFYKDQQYQGAVTQSAFDLSRFHSILPSLQQLTAALQASMPEAADQMWKAQRGSANFHYKTLWDIAHFCEVLGGASAGGVCDAADTMRSALAAGPENFIIAEAHAGPRVDRVGGLSIYLPPLADVNRFYGELDFARDTQWPALLDAYKAA